MVMSGAKKCWKCGKTVALEVKECPGCGELQDKSVEVPQERVQWTCPYCAKVIARVERDRHICKEMSEARMARARDNLKAPAKSRARAFNFMMLLGLGIFLVILNSGFYWGRNSKSFFMGLMTVIALVQLFASPKKKLPGFGTVGLLLYCANILLHSLTVLIFSSGYYVTARGLVGIWFVNSYLLRYFGRKKFVFLIGQYVLLGVIIGVGVLFARTALVEKLEALKVLFSGVLG